MIRIALASCALALAAAPLIAQDAPPPSGTVALTPEQREAAIEAGAMRAMDQSLQNGGSDRRVHGEMGVEVGSRGERAAYGTMVAPIGQNGMAAISYGTGQGPRWHGRHGRDGGRYSGSSFGAAYSSDGASVPVPPPAEAENVNPD
jgi:hypothetical protein